MSSPAPTGDSPTPEQHVYDEHRGSVVHMMSELATKEGMQLGVGTGFVVHNDGTSCLVLTCAHVIRSKESKRVSVRFGADHIASARLVHVSEHVDLALVHVQGAPNYIPLGFSDETDLSGKEVVAIGFFGLDSTSMCIDPATSCGNILGEAVVFPTDSGDQREFFACNLSSSKGMSGAPVFLEDKVAGVLSSSDAAFINVLTVASVKAVMKTWVRRNQGPEMTIRDMLQVIADKSS